MITLKQSTAYTFRIGPFLDQTDGKTAETGLTITQPDIRLSKAGGDFAQLAASGTLIHDEAGWYILTLATGDTDTVGSLIVAIHESGALPVWVEYQILEEATYDFLYAASATPLADINAEADTALAEYNGPTSAELVSEINSVQADIAALNDLSAAQVNAEADTALSDYNGPTEAEMNTKIDALNDPTAAAIADAVWNEAQAGHTDAGKAGQQQWTDIDAILADTNELQGDNVPGLIAALNDPDAAAIADQVWDEAKAGHVAAGSIGEEVQAHALTSEVSAVETDTQDIQSRLPTALVSGRMDASVGAMAAGVMTAAAIAADALTSAKIDATFGQEIADEILKRGLSNVEPSPGLRTVYGALASLVNRVKINGANLEIYETNDTTLVASIPITTDSGQDPITELDPA